MKVDLHCHSYYSDGKQSPAFLLQRAKEKRLSHLAITDHDCVDGLCEIGTSHEDITLINGVELSCLWNEMEVHIVGLFIDVKNSHIETLLVEQKLQREHRAQAIDQKLQKLGVQGLMPYLLSLPCTAYTRSHIADFLVQENICKNKQKAFKTHLGKRGKIYAPANCCTLAAGIAAIREAGGIAVLAHPGRYPLSKKKLNDLTDDFKDCGGEAIEGSYSNIDSGTKSYLSEMAAEKSLYLSVGSDFHDAAATWTDIGKFPALDQRGIKNAIWLHPKWHS
jgi:3',5'-nucleoside bisphosphate phosphatase